MVSPGDWSELRSDPVLPSPAVSAPVVESEVGAAPDDSDAWRRARIVALVTYLLSRLCVIAGAAGVSTAQVVSQRMIDPTEPTPNTATGGIFDVLNSWDGQWYYRIVRDGYPRLVPQDVSFHILEARAAFFPLYPFTVRYLDRILPGGDVFAALTMNAVLGFVAVLLVGVIARRLFGTEIAGRSMVLMALFPGSFVLSFAYSEALMFVLVALCLLALMRERWLWAGLAAALVSASRPNGVAICFACAVASYVAIRRSRDWRSLVAPALSPIGWVVFQVLLSRHTGEDGVWFRVQREAWDEGISFGMKAMRAIGEAIVHPLSSPANLLTLVTVFAMAIMVWAATKRRLPPPMIAYCVVILALMLLPSTVTARPRFLYTAFPLLISVAAWWRPSWRDQWNWLLVSCGAGLVLLPVLYGGFAAIP